MGGSAWSSLRAIHVRHVVHVGHTVLGTHDARQPVMKCVQLRHSRVNRCLPPSARPSGSWQSTSPRLAVLPTDLSCFHHRLRPPHRTGPSRLIHFEHLPGVCTRLTALTTECGCVHIVAVTVASTTRRRRRNVPVGALALDAQKKKNAPVESSAPVAIRLVETQPTQNVSCTTTASTHTF